MRALGEVNGMNYFAFRATFCQMGGYLGKQVIGPKDPSALNQILQGCSFRATKDDWIDLPKKIYLTRDVEMSPQQQRHYKEMKTEFLTMIAEQEIDANMVITQMLKLQQISSGFIMDASGVAHRIEGPDTKLAVLHEVLEESTGKVLIFTWFRETTRVLGETLRESHRPAMIGGGMVSGQILEQVERFNNDPSCRAMVCQIQSGKYGLTLLGGEGPDRCSTTVFYENSFSLDARLQAEDRNHRIGQDKPVVYVDLVASAIERVAINALRKKQDVAAAVIDNRQLFGV